MISLVLSVLEELGLGLVWIDIFSVCQLSITCSHLSTNYKFRTNYWCTWMRINKIQKKQHMTTEPTKFSFNDSIMSFTSIQKSNQQGITRSHNCIINMLVSFLFCCSRRGPSTTRGFSRQPSLSIEEGTYKKLQFHHQNGPTNFMTYSSIARKTY